MNKKTHPLNKAKENTFQQNLKKLSANILNNYCEFHFSYPMLHHGLWETPQKEKEHFCPF